MNYIKSLGNLIFLSKIACGWEDFLEPAFLPYYPSQFSLQIIIILEKW